jgi:hypothetical protein
MQATIAATLSLFVSSVEFSSGGDCCIATRDSVFFHFFPSGHLARDDEGKTKAAYIFSFLMVMKL